MFYADPQPTAFDLSWRMFGIPVRVHPTFWLVAVILGAYQLERGIQYLLLWVVCVFVSVLIHELGHALTGLAFGSPGSIILYSFGGVAVGASMLARRWQRVLVYSAGVFAELVFLAVAIAIAAFMGVFKDPGRFSPLVETAVDYLIWINLFWGILNLMPVWPLDGGQISREFFDWIMPRHGIRVSLILSMVVAALLAIAAAVLLRAYLMALFFGLMAFASFQMMQQIPRQKDVWDDDRTPWERDSESRDRDYERWER